ncbi:hypothetical protein [Ketobacter alkanivorans]|nr:hypothetical protein [Ketobacter alkanivorans]
MGRKVADVYQTRKVGEIHRKPNSTWVFWVIAAVVIFAIASGN